MDSLTDTMSSLDISESSIKKPGSDDSQATTKDVCCVCHDKWVNPIKLPCAHVFCYLCIKGVAARNNRCALCRQQIPPGHLDDPQSVVNKDQLKQELEASKEKKSCWFYEAKNGGWWMYEQRTSADIEQAYSASKKSVRLQISGFSYIIDLESMVQYREDRPNRRRSIKRDLVRLDSVKGIAGIRTSDEAQTTDSDVTGSS